MKTKVESIFHLHIWNLLIFYVDFLSNVCKIKYQIWSFFCVMVCTPLVMLRGPKDVEHYNNLLIKRFISLDAAFELNIKSYVYLTH